MFLRRRHRRVLTSLLLLIAVFVLVRFARQYHSGAKVISHEVANRAYTAVRDFVDVCHGLGFPVFIVERRVLESVVNVSWSACHDDCPVWCSHLCSHFPVTTFAVVSHQWKQSESVLDNFRVRQFSVTTVHHNAPWMNRANDTLGRDAVSRGASARLSQTLTVYCDFQHANGHTVRLVLFHSRGADRYYWHGRIMPHDTGPLDSTRFGQHAGLYQSIELSKVSLDGIKLRMPRNPSYFLSQTDSSRFIECDHQKAEAFYAEHGRRDTSDAARQFYNAARDLLITTKHVLDALNVRFWLSSGTCLGWFRQCDLIPYSKDVDIGIWITDYVEQIIPAMENSGLALIHRFGKVDDSFELSFLGADIKLDIFFFYTEPTYMWNGGTQARTGKKFKYIFPRFTLCWTEFLGLMVRVPCETQSYVEANYGKDWYYPVKSWDWKKSPPNVIENGAWPEHERDVVIQQFELKLN